MSLRTRTRILLLYVFTIAGLGVGLPMLVTAWAGKRAVWVYVVGIIVGEIWMLVYTEIRDRQRRGL